MSLFNNFVLCVEMFVFAFIHARAFPSSEFAILPLQDADHLKVIYVYTSHAISYIYDDTYVLNSMHSCIYNIGLGVIYNIFNLSYHSVVGMVSSYLCLILLCGSAYASFVKSIITMWSIQ